jgi:hypothetical protein
MAPHKVARSFCPSIGPQQRPTRALDGPSLSVPLQPGRSAPSQSVEALTLALEVVFKAFESRWLKKFYSILVHVVRDRSGAA